MYCTDMYNKSTETQNNELGKNLMGKGTSHYKQ